MAFAVEEFADFFADIHREFGLAGSNPQPFQWQWRLLRHLAATGRWPDQIAAPTGSGKKSVIDVHVFACALFAHGVSRRVPRRLAMVVDRRVLVDDQYEHAMAIARLLRMPTTPLIEEVADALASLRAAREEGPQPLEVARLRGGVIPSRSWLDDPAACQVLCCTPDMWGSRILFRGYLARSEAWPREAGLLAFDSVVVVDESHLCRQLVTTARRVTELCRVAKTPLTVPELQVVETTATPDESSGLTVIRVEQEDLDRDNVLARRLNTPKPVDLLDLPDWPIPRDGVGRNTALGEMADRAVELFMAHGPTVGCVVNNVTTALDLAKLLCRRGYTVETCCGRMRTHDLQRMHNRRPGLLSINGNADVHFLVATQCLEVGADLDWPTLLTELCPATALVQRAGRVNRRGVRDSARVVVTVPAADLACQIQESNEKEPGQRYAPYAPNELLAARGWIENRVRDPAGLAPSALVSDRPPVQSRRRTLFQRPELTECLQWARTSDALAYDADLDLWLSDDLEPDMDLGVVVRRDLPDEDDQAAEFLRALPPRDYEVFPASIRLAAQVIEKIQKMPDCLPCPRIMRHGEILRYSRENRLRPGDVIVIDSHSPVFTVAGDAGVLTADGTDRVEDVLGAGDRELVLRLDAPSFRNRDAADRFLQEAGELLAGPRMTQGLRDALARLVDGIGPAHMVYPIPEGITRLLRGRVKDCDVLGLRDAEGALSCMIVVDLRRRPTDDDQQQRWTRSDAPVPLSVHVRAVVDRADCIGRRVGLPEELHPLLVRAAQHHDDGKTHGRFQLALEAGGREVLAKSGMASRREVQEAWARSGLPRGWRHEQLSVVECWSVLSDLDPAARNLVARLVGTSHGRGRFLPSHTLLELDGGLDGEERSCANLLFMEGAWDELIEETHDRFGIWGCAYLEALLRAADCLVSSEGS